MSKSPSPRSSGPFFDCAQNQARASSSIKPESIPFLIGSRQTWALFPVMDLFKIQNVGRGVCVCLPAEWCAAYTVTWTPGLNVNWTRFWFKALSNISESCWNTENKNKNRIKLWVCFQYFLFSKCPDSSGSLLSSFITHCSYNIKNL